MPTQRCFVSCRHQNCVHSATRAVESSQKKPHKAQGPHLCPRERSGVENKQAVVWKGSVPFTRLYVVHIMCICCTYLNEPCLREDTVLATTTTATSSRFSGGTLDFCSGRLASGSYEWIGQGSEPNKIRCAHCSAELRWEKHNFN